jgi:magnesium chelatase subunit H
MPKRISAAEMTPVRVVIITMDSHFAGALPGARATLAREFPGLTLDVHSADIWAGDEHELNNCKSAIASADIIITTMLFLEDHISLVLPALTARRDECDAMICTMCAPEVVKLTRIGKLKMDGESMGAIGLLKKLRGKSQGKAGGPAGAAKSQMGMLRKLPKILRFIPGPAQDLRTYFLAMQYSLAGSSENIAGLVSMLVSRYAAGPRAGIGKSVSVALPIEYPDVGLYHPRAPGRIVTDRDALPNCKFARGTIGLLMLRSYVLAGDTAHYDGVISAFEKQGYVVIPAFASGLDARPAIDAYFMRVGKPTIDAMVSLTGFSLVGGPAYNDSASAELVLAALDVPYIVAHPLEFQTIQDWNNDQRGLTPIEATMMIALPELDGAIMPMTFGGRSTSETGDKERMMTSLDERAKTLAARVGSIVKLRRKQAAQRKIALVIFNFPPNAGSTGTAAYLSVFESLLNTMRALADAGYHVDVPADVHALREAVTQGNKERFGAFANVAARVHRDEHVKHETWLGEIEQVWGPAPGKQLSDGTSIFILGAQFGDLFVGIQPAFGYEGDPMRLLFERGFAPTHAFSAFYRWIKESFQADAVLHFGTHGALEFMPGKQAGMSGDCWPDRIIGTLPNFYFYASNNPSEGMLAKRRTGATLISHLTPPVTQAGLYRGLADLKSSLAHWRNLEPGAPESEFLSLASMIQAEAAAIDLANAEPAWGELAAAKIADLGRALLELEYTLIPHGLHVIGVPPNESERADLLDAAGIVDPAQRAAIDAVLAEDHEIPALLHALDGGFIRPAPGGDILRNLAVLPTGRNLYGFDPFRMPSNYAVEDGARQAERLLARHAAEGHGVPETVALVLWGSDNLKSEGGPIAQALWLIGAAPRRDSYGRLAGAQLVSLEKLGRPRIDVMVTLSGIFRDLLPLQIKLLAEASLLAATADEPVADNFIRKHALAFQAVHGGSLEDASLRVFSNGDGAYGANVNQLVDASTWESEDELGQAYLKRKGFAYGVTGKPARSDKLLGHILSSVDAAYQNLESVELGVTTVDHYFDGLGGMSAAIKSARGKKAALYIGDQTRGEGLVRTLGEQVAMETRSRVLNPKYYEALLKHGPEGVRQIEAQVTNTLGWSATTGEVEGWVYRQISETFVLDPVMRERLAALNPTASAKIANRLIEAQQRNYWQPDAATLDALRLAGEELEDRLEGLDMGVAA